jgi:hypothetical protein
VIVIPPQDIRALHAADLDGDGDLDALSSSYDGLGRPLGWYENLDGQGTFGPLRSSRPRRASTTSSPLTSTAMAISRSSPSTAARSPGT